MEPDPKAEGKVTETEGKTEPEVKGDAKAEGGEKGEGKKTEPDFAGQLQAMQAELGRVRETNRELQGHVASLRDEETRAAVEEDVHILDAMQAKPAEERERAQTEYIKKLEQRVAYVEQGEAARSLLGQIRDANAVLEKHELPPMTREEEGQVNAYVQRFQKATWSDAVRELYEDKIAAKQREAGEKKGLTQAEVNRAAGAESPPGTPVTAEQLSPEKKMQLEADLAYAKRHQSVDPKYQL